jgi:hypothetical protein
MLSAAQAVGLICEAQHLDEAQHQRRFSPPVIRSSFDFSIYAIAPSLLQFVRVALGKATHNNDWDVGSRWVLLEGSQYKLAPHFRQEHVQDDEVRPALAGQLQSFLAITNIDHAEAFFNENPLHCGPYEPAVFNYKKLLHG